MTDHQPSRATFSAIRARESHPAVIAVWEKAKQASQLRHECIRQGRRKAARRLGLLKASCIQRACELAPELIRRSVDRERFPGMPTFWLISTIGRIPPIAAPIPAPTKPDSDSGVSRIRSGPNSSNNPFEHA